MSFGSDELTIQLPTRTLEREKRDGEKQRITVSGEYIMHPNPNIPNTMGDPPASLWTTIPPQPDTTTLITKDPISTDSIPPTLSADNLYGTTSTSSTSTPSSTTAVAAAAAAAATYNNYNSYPTAAGYTMYTSATNPTAYYQQITSNLRAQQSAAAAAAFPYGLTAATTPSAYYAAGSYPVDYSSAYNPQQYYRSYYNPLGTAAAYAAASSLSDVTLATSSSGSAAGAINDAAFAIKEKKVKVNKKKKNGSCSPGDETFVRVFIWDIDDITMLSRNIIGHLANQLPDIAASGILLYRLVESVVSVHFNDPNELQEGDVINIEDAVVDETIIDGPIDNLRGLDVMRRVAPKYNALRHFYNQMSDGFKGKGGMISYELLDKCNMMGQEGDIVQAILKHQEVFWNRWQCANRSLELVTERSAESHNKYANIVLCGEGVAYGAAQLLISGNSSTIPIDNIYSTTKGSKESIFEKIQTRFGKKCCLVVITSSADTASIAKKLSIPVWPVVNNNGSGDIDKLVSAQRDYLLG